jgi:hypothetical protein
MEGVGTDTAMSACRNFLSRAIRPRPSDGHRSGVARLAGLLISLTNLTVKIFRGFSYYRQVDLAARAM